ncbi:UNKNOWN [Stylonychia lemnae]|uniref:MD-2-related lipid-recognition domain-containing protein n=1 Tax=Stylonychia lemnae TaxID=5949 RepID=A0A078AAQ2_STYLE|nr:UNKNOWN [Stylonychia lemnae]|eukprot:CDW79360.1 UNKNOWN [Stylonychia lemnae]
MRQSLLLTLVLLINVIYQGVQGQTEINLAPEDFIKGFKPYEALKALIQQQINGEVSWGTCESAEGFKADLSSTHSEPKIPVKGKDVLLNLAGTFTDDINLDKINVYVEWNKTPLYTNDFPRQAVFAASDPYTDQIKWAIPAYAPSGHYAVKISMIDDQKISIACITADFDL